MYALAILFVICLGVLFYTYIGYGVIVGILATLKKISKTGIHRIDENFLPSVTLVIPCFNEATVLADKVENSLALDYPKSKLHILFITDGSTDGSELFLKKHKGIEVLHNQERRGKAAAENRAIAHVKSDFVVFCDANTFLNADAIKHLMKHFADEKVGAVSGEKRVAISANSVSASGEGLYWKYESWLKKQDSSLHTLAGAAGELIAFRKSCFLPLEEDTILDDFVATMRIAINGYKVVYEPLAYASEMASASVEEELKRKIRIAAGTWQALFRLPKALNPLHDALLTFIYFSHKVMRWVFSPLALVLLFPIGMILHNAIGGWFTLLWIMQLMFYFFASLGKVLEIKNINLKLFYMPYYFIATNYCMIMGFIRFVRGKQSVNWEKAIRAQ
ncbi:MAG: glycosyltransferase family 2 protein [Bacteroidia bacterium]|nr:glycosyltransferase family 2 protein [Bacteroidia bacterium]